MYNWLSDLSSLYLAQKSWNEGIYNTQGIFHLHHGVEGANTFSIACGASLLAEHIRRFRFSPEVIQKLGQVTDEKGRCVFEESFLNYLQRLKLSVNIKMPQEGTMLLPNEPLLVLEGPHAQVQLLSSAIHQLVWRSSHWATKAALTRWEKHAFKEENTARSPKYDFTPEGWYARASFIGGASIKSIVSNDLKLAEEVVPNRLQLIWLATSPTQAKTLQQIRRAYKGTDPVGDIWMNEAQEKNTSVSKTQAEYTEITSETVKNIKFTRFQNLYLPLLVNGRSVVTPTRKGYLRQRTLHQMAAFSKVDLNSYGMGWIV
jgi:Nicotinate phosphoribosyltransferase (NAPRTase) N-terminal domain